jgi:hypothetical protein
MSRYDLLLKQIYNIDAKLNKHMDIILDKFKDIDLRITGFETKLNRGNHG